MFGKVLICGSPQKNIAQDFSHHNSCVLNNQIKKCDVRDKM